MKRLSFVSLCDLRGFVVTSFRSEVSDFFGFQMYLTGCSVELHMIQRMMGMLPTVTPAIRPQEVQFE